MASAPSNETPAGKLGLTIETTTPHIAEKRSESSPSPLQPFPAFEEKEAQLSRPSDVSSPSTARADPFDTDIEAMVTHNFSRRSAECTKGGSDCEVWPGQDHWRRKAKAAKRKRRYCNCLAGLSKRNRIIVKILIIMLIVGIAVGVGFGVSKPLGAGVWRSETQNSP
ncbi:e3a3e82a-a57c-4c34-98cc-c4d315cfe596 [Thermothielavioides terrestris]|jgi:hypothetical protein|uniref:Uncharacterized protein n=2 Tax=Thermothielavioides terrestris TaxID=2587410 RepID=G2QVN2_THETT|nr:uncharacterized protein THITE_2107861 [Thermothielavioides terrestris NRRL 8126]AEO63013.1 hypothetical protein THITE_2107861 [Thermothielavioides terrestris NRRL 8126]SPQ21495.1 e3a3e82a-a57c-4c34-98cc-c4d315cfe596 [Thermothielavioides terrestris]